jgi:hypothetical protein
VWFGVEGRGASAKGWGKRGRGERKGLGFWIIEEGCESSYRTIINGKRMGFTDSNFTKMIWTAGKSDKGSGLGLPDKG